MDDNQRERAAMAQAGPERGAVEAASPPWPGWLIATAICVRFYSRLPVPALPGESDIHAPPDFRLVPRALPLAGLMIALPPALVMLACGLAGLAPLMTAALAVAALVLCTGALHEDGLADAADGLFGGRTPERRLEIMKDARVGSFGVTALGLALILRVAGLAAILEGAGRWGGAGALLVAAMVSRAGSLSILALEAPARAGGASAAVGRPTTVTLGWAISLALCLSVAIAAATLLPLAGLALGLILAALACLGIARLARRLIGGQTGDIVGAGQQIAEIAVYLGFALMLGKAAP